jgi:hypothetical protein
MSKKDERVRSVLSCIKSVIIRLSSMVHVDVFSQVDCVCDCTSLSLNCCVAANLYFDKSYDVDL